MVPSVRDRRVEVDRLDASRERRAPAVRQGVELRRERVGAETPPRTPLPRWPARGGDGGQRCRYRRGAGPPGVASAGRPRRRRPRGPPCHAACPRSRAPPGRNADRARSSDRARHTAIQAGTPTNPPCAASKRLGRVACRRGSTRQPIHEVDPGEAVVRGRAKLIDPVTAVAEGDPRPAGARPCPMLAASAWASGSPSSSTTSIAATRCRTVMRAVTASRRASHGHGLRGRIGDPRPRVRLHGPAGVPRRPAATRLNGARRLRARIGDRPPRRPPPAPAGAPPTARVLLRAAPAHGLPSRISSPQSRGTEGSSSRIVHQRQIRRSALQIGTPSGSPLRANAPAIVRLPPAAQPAQPPRLGGRLLASRDACTKHRLPSTQGRGAAGPASLVQGLALASVIHWIPTFF